MATSAIACGLEVRGLVGSPDDGGVDASTELDATSAPPESEASIDGAADAPFDCGEGGGFCDLCDETLLLCLPFDDDAKDKSRYEHALIVLGQLGFGNGAAGHGRAMEIDAATTIRVAHNQHWEGYSALTIEMFIRPNAFADAGGRAGLVDKNSTFGFFVQPNGDLTCTAGGAVRGQPDGGLDGGRFVHVACVGGGGKTTLYARGVLLHEVDASNPTASNEELAIAGNSPAGDPFNGGIDALRIYKRAKTPEEIRESAVGRSDAGDAAGD